jgi:hypothetical protein
MHHSLHAPAETRSLHPHETLMHWWSGAGGGVASLWVISLLMTRNVPAQPRGDAARTGSGSGACDVDAGANVMQALSTNPKRA